MPAQKTLQPIPDQWLATHVNGYTSNDSNNASPAELLETALI